MIHYIILFLSLFLFTISKADEATFTCKPVYAAVQTENGTFYEETLEEMDEEAGLLSVVPISKFSIRNDGFFYKNNPLRRFEYLKTYNEIMSDEEISPKIINAVNEIEEASILLDKKLGEKNLKTFYLPYLNYSQDGNLLSSSIKRISINTKNNFTSEITIPSHSIDGVSLYYFLRKCDGEGIKVDFEPAFNKALS
tara:strand:- start:414 stop:1001 length:588 start_codon:yes stop_codon:yes gene_type:complete